MGLCIQGIASRRSAVQRNEGLLSNVETISGAVDGGEINRPVCLLVGQLPALAAVGRTEFNVECGANVWEVGEILEMRVFVGEAVWPVRARNAVGVAIRVVVFGVPRDFMRGKD